MSRRSIGSVTGQPREVPSSPNMQSSNGAEPSAQLSPRSGPNVFVRFFRAAFGYRKTSLTFLVALTIVLTVLILAYDNLLDLSVSLPTNKSEIDILNYAWTGLQQVGRTEHTYTSKGNDYVHDYLLHEVTKLSKKVGYVDVDNDLNYTNNIMMGVNYLSYESVSYYESNNVLVRINGTNEALPAYLVSAHYDSVPSSYGITDDGMGVATLLGLLRYYTKYGKQPERTIILNFNNNEEFGLYGATAFLSHPWFAGIKYFLNLEGTGAGGKAVLFRGTDYGIVKHFSVARTPYATSIFQQGFNNKLIHSETDYAVYAGKGGLRGLDLAFYKPRDIYHTGRDNIQNTSKKSLWHMLSNALDFSNHFAYDDIDLDSELTGVSAKRSLDFASYGSLLNHFWSFSASQIVVFNIVLLVTVPVVSLVFMFVVFKTRKAWNVNVVNVLKFPISFVLSVFTLNFLTDVLIVPFNGFAINSSSGTLVNTLFALFLLLNYILLNGLNILLKPFKGHQHDEKLIVLIEISFISWVLLIFSTAKLNKNKIGDDHTGEVALLVFFTLISIATTLGLIGWSFKSTKGTSREGYEPLLESSSRSYGANDSLSESLPLEPEVCSTHAKKSFSYDWLIQFLLVVPIPSLIIYNSGWLILEGVKKLVQESAKAQDFVYRALQLFVVLWALPFLPFVFKLNRIIFLALLLVVIQGTISLGLSESFTTENPMKLRFLETLNLSVSPPTNVVSVSARLMPAVVELLSDLPSVKRASAEVFEVPVGDGMLLYNFETSLMPRIDYAVKPEDLLEIEILKNSSSFFDSPFGFLTGEIRIYTPKSRNCKVSFNVSDNLVKTFAKLSSPVRTVIVHADDSDSDVVPSSGTPDGFSRDSEGNYVYKSSDGIAQLQLNKLNWDKPYHISFQWAPEIVEADAVEDLKVNIKKLGVEVECYWSERGYTTDLNGTSVHQIIPAYEEVLHYSPNYVTWANRDRGLVSATKYVEI